MFINRKKLIYFTIFEAQTLRLGVLPTQLLVKAKELRHVSKLTLVLGKGVDPRGLINCPKTTRL